MDEQFPKGSGPNGDMYDMGYYHGKFYDIEKQSIIDNDNDNLDGFIVEDNSEIEYDENSDSDSEIEIEYDENSDSEIE